jgi:hypothetical protein
VLLQRANATLRTYTADPLFRPKHFGCTIEQLTSPGEILFCSKNGGPRFYFAPLLAVKRPQQTARTITIRKQSALALVGANNKHCNNSVPCNTLDVAVVRLQFIFCRAFLLGRRKPASGVVGGGVVHRRNIMFLSTASRSLRCGAATTSRSAAWRWRSLSSSSGGARSGVVILSDQDAVDKFTQLNSRNVLYFTARCVYFCCQFSVCLRWYLYYGKPAQSHGIP